MLAPAIFPGAHLALGLSGGVDSVALLSILLELAPALKVSLRAVHVNHGISPNAARWAEFCTGLCARSGIALQLETVDIGAYRNLVQQGKVRAIGASNLDAEQLRASLDAAKAKALPRYDVLQPEYNLYDRSSLDGPLLDLCVKEEIGVITYFSLAKGFLSGKYRSEADLSKSPRGDGVKAYLNPRGFRILDALEAVAASHKAKPAEVALAWAMARPGVTAERGQQRAEPEQRDVSCRRRRQNGVIHR